MHYSPHNERSPSDAGLLGRMAAGDERALGILYDRFGEVAYGLAIAATDDASMAESVVGDAFMHLWRGAHLFAADGLDVLLWLTTIVRSLARAELARSLSFGRRRTKPPLWAAPTPRPLSATRLDLIPRGGDGHRSRASMGDARTDMRGLVHPCDPRFDRDGEQKTRHEQRESAAAYALGALDTEARLSFEAHLANCHDCLAEVGAHRAVVRLLALAVRVGPFVSDPRRTARAGSDDRARTLQFERKPSPPKETSQLSEDLRHVE